VVGIDSSPEMVRRAGEVEGISAELGDIQDWAADPGRHRAAPVDVLVTNAALQWVPGHLELLPALVEQVAPGGWFALQVPGNFEEPSHTIRRDLAAEPDYAAHTEGIAAPAAHDARTYLRVLQGLGWEVDAWETTYLHVLQGEDPVFTWVSGTGARPTLQALPEGLRPRFEAEFRRRLREAYPADARGRVVLRFRRVFVVAHRLARRDV
jgi:trans-aconitate 2-methyltransferase